MHPVEIQAALDSMIILVDSREHDTPSLRKRLEAAGRPTERIALISGDYSCKCMLPSGEPFSLARRIVIERKMGLDELAQNFTRGRARFIREFERLKDTGGKAFLLVENGSWENIIAHKYRSQFAPKAFLASIAAWQARYDSHIIFCKPETTGVLIERLLYYQLKEILESGELG